MSHRSAAPGARRAGHRGDRCRISAAPAPHEISLFCDAQETALLAGLYTVSPAKIPLSKISAAHSPKKFLSSKAPNTPQKAAPAARCAPSPNGARLHSFITPPASPTALTMAHSSRSTAGLSTHLSIARSQPTQRAGLGPLRRRRPLRAPACQHFQPRRRRRIRTLRKSRTRAQPQQHLRNRRQRRHARFPAPHSAQQTS